MVDCQQQPLSESLDSTYSCVCVFVFLFFSFFLFFFLPAVVFDFSTCSLYTFHQLVYCSQQNKRWSAHQWVPLTVYGPHKHHFSTTFLLKMSPTTLFTHLKIILLQCFQFSISATFNFSNNKLNPNGPLTCSIPTSFASTHALFVSTLMLSRK